MVKVAGADAVIVAGPLPGGSKYIRELDVKLEATGTELVLASRLTNVAGPRIHWRPVDGLPLVHVELPQYAGGKHVLKRVVDVVAASAALVVLSPPNARSWPSSSSATARVQSSSARYVRARTAFPSTC